MEELSRIHKRRDSNNTERTSRATLRFLPCPQEGLGASGPKDKQEGSKNKTHRRRGGASGQGQESRGGEHR